MLWAGLLGTAVPQGTIDHVVSARTGLFDDEYVTIQFESGYTEEVSPLGIEHRGFFG